MRADDAGTESADIRRFDGRVVPGDEVSVWPTGKRFGIDKNGYCCPAPTVDDALGPGERGSFIAGVKDTAETQASDAVRHAARRYAELLPGCPPATLVESSGLDPTEGTTSVARAARKAAPERQCLQHRASDQRNARLGLR